MEKNIIIKVLGINKKTKNERLIQLIEIFEENSLNIYNKIMKDKNKVESFLSQLKENEILCLSREWFWYVDYNDYHPRESDFCEEMNESNDYEILEERILDRKYYINDNFTNKLLDKEKLVEVLKEYALSDYGFLEFNDLDLSFAKNGIDFNDSKTSGYIDLNGTTFEWASVNTVSIKQLKTFKESNEVLNYLDYLKKVVGKLNDSKATECVQKLFDLIV